MQFGHYALPESAQEGKADDTDEWLLAHITLCEEQKTSARRSAAICDVLRQFRLEAEQGRIVNRCFESLSCTDCTGASKCMQNEQAGSRARSRLHAALDAESTAQDRTVIAVTKLAEACKQSKEAKLETALLADIERLSSGHDSPQAVTGSIL